MMEIEWNSNPQTFDAGHTEYFTYIGSGVTTTKRISLSYRKRRWRYSLNGMR